MADIQKAKSNQPIKHGGAVVGQQLAFGEKTVSNLTREILNAPVGASVTGTWVCPDNVTRIKVECWGQGGRGGSMIGTANAAAGGGGGAAYAASILDVVPSTSYSYAIGNAQASAVVATWFSGLTVVFAQPGRNGATSSAVPGGGGLATGCYGEVRVDGQAGQSGTDATTISPLVDGGYYGGGGGNPGNYEGAVGAARNTASPSGGGSVGSIPGGGGSGGKRSSAGTALGGFGGAGQIVITYETQTPSLAADITVVQDKYTERFDDQGYYG